ncbi:MAG TPA: HAD family phosphatase [Chloroflexia bacterium]|nr:HAD family phosphatase [Chloroflexia bacterium]
MSLNGRNGDVAIRAVVFDIGGVLEIAPRTGWDEKWEAQLQLKPRELRELLHGVWRGGSVGTISEEEVEKSTAEILGLDQAQLDAFMHDLWEEYLGKLNVELAAYFAGLRPRYRTAILSNSFVGARRKEQERYGFGDMCDLIIYSHEEGMSKPDRRIFELTCERLGLQPGEVLFLDDVEEAVIAARELGIHAIPFRDTAQAISDIQACLEGD